MNGCKPDSSGANWFKCHRGTVGCPRIHDGLTPHCVACTAGGPCPWGHEPPGLEMTEDAYYALGIVARPKGDEQ